MMTETIPMVDVWRGPVCESYHSGLGVVCNAQGEVIHSWGDITKTVLPRSCVKMIQALPLITSGAAHAASLQTEQLALACSSHQGAPMHTQRISAWLDSLGKSHADLLCGDQIPQDRATRHDLIRSGEASCPLHHNCSGKHSGFLTLNAHLKGNADYVAPDHPVQLAAKAAFEEVTGGEIHGFGVDGCSAPNFASSLEGIGRAMGFFAGAKDTGTSLERAAVQLREAMAKHPDLVAGDGRACTELMRAAGHQSVIKMGAEGLFTAILPELGLGVALKAMDGVDRAAECMISAVLVHLGVLDAQDPIVVKRLSPVMTNSAGRVVGQIRPSAGFPA
jgi:L-asparaginase II